MSFSFFWQYSSWPKWVFHGEMRQVGDNWDILRSSSIFAAAQQSQNWPSLEFGWGRSHWNSFVFWGPKSCLIQDQLIPYHPQSAVFARGKQGWPLAEVGNVGRYVARIPTICQFILLFLFVGNSFETSISLSKGHFPIFSPSFVHFFY
jgi:hypothetical protein